MSGKDESGLSSNWVYCDLRVEARRGEAPTAILFSVVVDHVVQLTPSSVDDVHATCGQFIGLLHACRVASFDDGHFIVVHKTL